MIRASGTAVLPTLGPVSGFGGAWIDGNPPVTKYGTTGDDVLVGFGGDDTLYGMAGNDVLDGGAGRDIMAGGTGDDSYYVDNLGDIVWEWGGQGTDWVNASVDNYTLATGVEHLVLIGSAISGTGNELDNYITGTAANNALYGMAGNDVLDGWLGADVMAGGTGNDTYYVDDVGDIVWEWGNEGNDTVVVSFSPLSYVLDATVENLELRSGIEGIGNALNNVITGNVGDNKLYGFGGHDTLRGGDGQDQLYGGEGNDILDGGLGFDFMAGGTGNDVYYVDAVFNNDRISENAGEGIDTVYATFNYRMDANVENMQLIGVLGHDGWGNELGNTIWGSEFDNIIRSRDGNDMVYGYAGVDILDGGAGADTIYGGTGADSFVFRFLQDAVPVGGLTDYLPDFNQAEGDKIDLSAIDADINTVGQQHFTFIGNNNPFYDIGQLRFNGGFVEGDVNGDLVADLRIQVSTPSLVTADFIL